MQQQDSSIYGFYYGAVEHQLKSNVDNNLKDAVIEFLKRQEKLDKDIYIGILDRNKLHWLPLFGRFITEETLNFIKDNCIIIRIFDEQYIISRSDKIPEKIVRELLETNLTNEMILILKEEFNFEISNEYGIELVERILNIVNCEYFLNPTKRELIKFINGTVIWKVPDYSRCKIYSSDIEYKIYRQTHDFPNRNDRTFKKHLQTIDEIKKSLTGDIHEIQ